jgi:hypothetical protein
MAQRCVLIHYRIPNRTVEIRLPKVPICKHCHRPYRIITHSKPRLIHSTNDCYSLITYYYGCRRKDCSGGIYTVLIHASNNLVATHSHYDYHLMAKISHLRWKHNQTYAQIKKYLRKKYRIKISLRGIELILKIYERACAETFPTPIIEQIQKNGRLILSIDAMKPLNGEEGIYGVYDVLTGAPIASGQIGFQSEKCISKFIKKIEDRLKSAGITVPIVATIGDALVAQRLSIEKCLPNAKICLCHYHFYESILKPAKQDDSALVTTLRKGLRRLHYLYQYKRYTAEETSMPWDLRIQNLLKVINSLSNWRSKPKKGCFFGPIYTLRLQNLQKIIKNLNKISENFSIKDQRVLIKLSIKFDEILDGATDRSECLLRIQQETSKIKTIMDNDEAAEIGVLKFNEISKAWKYYLKQNRKTLNPLELEFLTIVCDYIDTKGVYLMNYRRVPGAPRTNNAHEQKYHRIKYKLRRIIGHVGAKEYLSKHGKDILFVNPDSSEKEIEDILRNANIPKIRKQIREEQHHRDELEEIMYDDKKWDAYIKALNYKLTGKKHL